MNSNKIAGKHKIPAISNALIDASALVTFIVLCSNLDTHGVPTFSYGLRKMMREREVE